MKSLFGHIKHWLLFIVFSLSKLYRCQNCKASNDISLAKFLFLVPCFQLDCVCVSVHLPSLHALEAHNELLRACDWVLSAEEQAEVWGSWGWGKYTAGLFHMPQKYSN